MIGQCTKLTMLFAAHNQLTTLPDAVEKCKDLAILGVDNNQFNTLPDAIKKCESLSSLSITQNYLLALPNDLREILSDIQGNSINKTQCLDLQKKQPIKKEQKIQEKASMRPR